MKVFVVFLSLISLVAMCAAGEAEREQRFFCVSLGRLCAMDHFSTTNAILCNGFQDACPDPAETACCAQLYVALAPSEKETLIKSVPPRDKEAYMRVFENWSRSSA